MASLQSSEALSGRAVSWACDSRVIATPLLGTYILQLFTSHPAYFTKYPPSPCRHVEILADIQESALAFPLQLRNGDTAPDL